MKILLPIDESPCSAKAIETVVRAFDPAATEVCVVHAIERAPAPRHPRGRRAAAGRADGLGAGPRSAAAFAAGFNHHMTKPPDSARLEALLASIAESGSS